MRDFFHGIDWLRVCQWHLPDRHLRQYVLPTLNRFSRFKIIADVV